MATILTIYNYFRSIFIPKLLVTLFYFLINSIMYIYWTTLAIMSINTYCNPSSLSPDFLQCRQPIVRLIIHVNCTLGCRLCRKSRVQLLQFTVNGKISHPRNLFLYWSIEEYCPFAEKKTNKQTKKQKQKHSLNIII